MLKQTAAGPHVPRRALFGALAAVGKRVRLALVVDVRGVAAAAASLLTSLPSHALITGSKPPEGGFKAKERKSIDECEAQGEKTRAKAEEGQDTSFERTSGGDRYRDLTVGGGPAASNGDAVEIRYRVMRLGTKARDGLSGEGQTIFSYGFGEDEDKPGERLPVVMRGDNLVAGVNDALVGMRPGGRRRVLVRPERGWKIQTGTCAEGEKKIDLDGAAVRTSSQEGNMVFRADIGAAIENEGACMSKTRLPQPRTAHSGSPP